MATLSIFKSNDSFIGSGDGNTINKGSDCSFIAGGGNNNIGAVSCCGMGSIFSIIGGGFSNCIDDTSFISSGAGIFAGSNHCVSGNNLFIGAGDTNNIFSALGAVSCSVIVGGYQNTICDDGTVTADLSFIGAGDNNFVYGCLSSVVGGTCNCATGVGSFIGGGECNITNGTASVVVGGFRNQSNSNETFVGAGNGNKIYACSCHSFIGAGLGNVIGNPTSLSCGSIESFIGGGQVNCIDSDTVNISRLHSIVGGSENTICSGCIINSSILGGANNTVSGSFSVVNGGSFNLIGSTTPGNPFADHSFIGGGSQNCIDSTGAATTYGIISGGSQNCICAGTNYSSIFSGQLNVVSGSCSSIFGGSGNCDNGFNWAGVFGCNVIGVIDCAFHTNNFVAQNMPDETALPLPTGTFYYCSSTNAVYKA